LGGKPLTKRVTHIIAKKVGFVGTAGSYGAAHRPDISIDP
jgi:hypothetical protein